MSETLREIRAVGTLVQKFTYQNGEKIPIGVNPKQLDFLREASDVGAFMRVKPQTARLITEYFTTDATYADLGKQYGVTEKAVQTRIFRGIEKLHTVLHRKRPRLYHKNTYPPEEIKKGKDKITVLRSERSRVRAREATKRRRTP